MEEHQPAHQAPPEISALEAAFHGLFLRAADPMWLVHPHQLTILASNPAAAALASAGSETNQRPTLADLPADPAGSAALQRAVLEQRPAWQGRLRLPGGETAPAELSFSRLPYQGETAVWVTAVLARPDPSRGNGSPDSSLQARLAEAFEFSAQGISLSDAGSETIQVCNPAFANIVGRTVEELRGMPISELFPEEERPRSREESRKADREGRAHYEAQYLLPGGRRKAVQVDLVTVHGPDGQPLYRVATIQDIEERRQADDRLRAVKVRLEEAEAIAGLGSWEFDVRTQQGWWSSQLYRMTGFEEARGVPPWEDYMESIHPDDRHLVADALARMAEGRIPNLVEYRSNPAWGTLRTFQPSVRSELDRSGRPVRFVGTTLDITRRKEVERELQKRNTELSTLYSLAVEIRQTQTSTELMELVLDSAMALFEAEAGWIALLTGERSQFQIFLARGSWAEAQGRTYPIAQGLSGITLRSSQPFVTQNYAREADVLEFQKSLPGGPAVYVPLRSEVELIGVLAVARPLAARPFGGTEVRMLASLAELAGAALRRHNLYENARKRLDQLQALHRIDRAITGSNRLEEMLEVILVEVCRLQNVDAAAVLVCDPAVGELTCRAALGFSDPAQAQARLRAGEGIPGQVLEQRQTQCPSPAKSWPACPRLDLAAREGFTAYCASPLVTRGRPQGVLEIFSRRPLEGSPEWLTFLASLAEQTAIAIHNATLVDGLESANEALLEAYDATILGWSHALELRDKETEGHTLRVTEMALALAREMGLAEEKQAHMRRGALLHDIGKLGIPDQILHKPGDLTEEEKQVMRQHPQMALDMLKPISYLHPALEIPYYHHEHWDGSGYPTGLRGEEIPLTARIFAVVDVWDALLSERPYAPAWTEEDALEYIAERSGTQFDPQVVRAFLDLRRRRRG